AGHRSHRGSATGRRAGRVLTGDRPGRCRGYCSSRLPGPRGDRGGDRRRRGGRHTDLPRPVAWRILATPVTWTKRGLLWKGCGDDQPDSHTGATAEEAFADGG